MEKEIFKLDPTDIVGLRQIMDQHGDSKMPFFGTNEHGEDVIISVFKDKIVVQTFQNNGWFRKNVYDRDGTREELFDGRWEEPEERESLPRDPKAAYKKGFGDGYIAGSQKIMQSVLDSRKDGPAHRQTMEQS